jgi:hypothetical protein
METATIITLGNRTSSSPTSFEEAFGEFSEARGRGRARRQKRRMERIANRRERRKARQEMRLDKKRSRVQARTERRQMRSDSRENRRNQRAEGKRGRERADLEQERELNPEQEEEQQGGDDGGYAPQGGYDDAPQGGYDDAPQGGYDDAPQEDSGYAQEDGGYDDGGYAQEEGGYEEQSDEFDGDYDDFDGDDTDDFDGDEENDGFDGESYEFDGSNEMIDAPYSAKVNEGVADAAQKIEWNLELASRLKEKQNQNPSAKISDAIDNCNARVVELKSQLDGYCNFEGEFVSDADGKMRFRRKMMARRKRRQKQTPNVKLRGREIMEARRIARAKRNAIRMKQGLTPVKASLNPQMGTNKIVIPAKELGSNYTGLTGLDDAMAYDASATEIKLGVDGNKTSKIPFKAIAIGVAVGALGIFLLRRYKVI